MIGREYFTQQAATLLKLARITKSQSTATVLAAKAAELQAQAGHTPDPIPPPPAQGPTQK